jgi:hypothetical protein
MVFCVIHNNSYISSRQETTKKNWLRKYDPKRNQMLKQKRHPPNSQITLHLAGFGTFMFKKKTEKVQSYKKETRLIDTPNIKSWIPIALEIQLIK